MIFIGEEGFVFGRHSSESFDVRCLDGRKLSVGVSYKKLKLVEKRKSQLIERRMAVFSLCLKGSIHRQNRMNEPIFYDDKIPEELIDGQLVAMSPRPTVHHSIISWNIYSIFRSYLKGKPCKPFADGIDLYLSDKDHFIPDMMVVCDRDKIKRNRIHGAPALVVEILSPSTAKRDKGYKRNAYEAAGVKEYWIVNPVDLSIESYILDGGKYRLDNVYIQYQDYELDDMTAEEKAAVPKSFRCSLFPNLEIPLKEVFDF